MDGTSFTVGRVPGFGNCALTILMVHGCKPSCSISCKTIDSLRCGEYVPIFCCGWPCSDRGVSSVLPKGPKKTEAVISTASPSTLQKIGRAPSELQSHSDLVCRLLLEKKKKN